MPSFDPKCYELAVHFLPDDATEERKCELASDIQAYVELMAKQQPTAQFLAIDWTRLVAR